MDKSLTDKIIQILLEEKRKEYACHVSYVAKIGKQLAEQLSADVDVVEMACLLHDIGRDKELSGEDHSETSLRIAKDILRDSNFTPAQLNLIYDSILTHGSDDIPETIEQKIVRSADAGSKVEFHEAFMLMCKKTTYEERLVWGQKYLESGFEKICIEPYREKLREKYQSIKSIYESTLATSKT